MSSYYSSPSSSLTRSTGTDFSVSSTPSLTKEEMKRLILDKDKDIVKTREMLSKARDVIMQMKQMTPPGRATPSSTPTRSDMSSFYDNESDYSSDTSGIRQTIMQVNQALTRRTETVEGLRRRLTETEDIYVKEIQELQSKIAQLQGEIVRSTVKMTDMEEELRHTRQTESENRNLRETIQLMTQREEAMKRAQEGNQYMLQELEDKDHIILDHISKIDQLEMEVKNLKEQRSASDKELSMLRKELDVTRKRRDSQQSDFSSKQLEHEESERLLREEHQEEVEKLNKTIQELEQKLEDALYTASENENLIRKRHFQDLVKTKEEMNHITIQRDALNTEYRDLNEMYNNALLQNDRLTQELEKWKMERSTLEDIVKFKTEENEQLLHKLDGLQNDFNTSAQKNSTQIHMLKMEHLSALDNIRRQNTQFMDVLQQKLNPQEDNDAFKLQCVREMRRAQEHFTEELGRLTREILHPKSGLEQDAEMQEDSVHGHKMSNQDTADNILNEMDNKIEESRALILNIERECVAMFDEANPKERESTHTSYEQSKLSTFLKTSMDRHVETFSQLRERYIREFNRIRERSKDKRVLRTGARKLVKQFVTEIGRAELAFSSAVTQMKLIDDKELWLDQASQQMKSDAARKQLDTLYDNLVQNNDDDDDDVNKLLETIVADDEHMQRESALRNVLQEQKKEMNDIQSKIRDIVPSASDDFAFERSTISTLFHQLTRVYWTEKDEIRSKFIKLRDTQTVSNAIDVENHHYISITAERVKHLCSLVDTLFEFGTLAQRHNLNLEIRTLKSSNNNDETSPKKGAIDEEGLIQYQEKRLKFDRILLSKLESRIDTIRKAISSDEEVDSDSDIDLESAEPEERRVSARLGNKMRVLKHLIKHLIKRYKISEQQCQQLKDGILDLRRDRNGNLVQPRKSHEKATLNADLNNRSNHAAFSDPKFILTHVMDIIDAKEADNIIVSIMQLVEKASHVPQYVRFMRHCARILEQEKRLPKRTKSMGTIITETGEIFNLDFLFSKLYDMQDEANHARDMSDFIHRVQTEIEKSIIAVSTTKDHDVYQKFFFSMKILAQDYKSAMKRSKEYPRISMIQTSSAMKRSNWKVVSEEEQQRETLEYVRQLLQVSNIDPIRSRVRELVAREKQQSEEVKLLQRQYHKFIELSSQLRTILDVESAMDIVPRVNALSKEAKRFNQAYPKLQNLLNDLCRAVQVNRVDELLPSVRKLVLLSRSMGHMFSNNISPPQSSGPGSPLTHRGKQYGYKDTRSADTTDISDTASFTVDDFIGVLLQED